MSTTSSPPTVDTDAADIAVEVERMMQGWRTADAAKRGEYRRSLARARDWWNSLPVAAQADPGNMRRERIRAGVGVEIDRLDAAARAAEQAEADRKAERDRQWWEQGQRALRAKERRQRVEDWILDNVDVDFRSPVDPAQLTRANPQAVRYLMRDGVPLEVPAADVATWKDAHDEGVEWGCNWFVYGPSGCGKTRLAWHLTMEHARRVSADIRFWSFHRWTRVYQFAQQSEEALSEYADTITETEWIILDEFNPSMTEAQAEGFLGLLKARFDRHTRLIVTSMFSMDDCLARWDKNPNLEEWGRAIRRRLEGDRLMTPVYLGRE